MFLALREIKHQPTRFVLIVAVITLVAYVTFFLSSLSVGLAHSYRAALDSWDAGSVILTEASNNTLAASRMSEAQQNTAEEAARANGGTAASLVSVGAVAQRGTDSGIVTKTNVYALGVDLTGMLAPVVAEGSAVSDADTQVIVDDSMKNDGWALGDTLQLAGTDHDWTIVGFAHDATFQAAPVVFIDQKALLTYGGQALSPSVNAIIGSKELTQAETDSLATAELVALTPAEFIDTLPGYSAQVLTFTLMIGALVIIASVVLGIFLYVLTLQKRPILGIMKARGIPTSYLITAGGSQTAVLAGTGVVIGLLLTIGTSLVLPPAVPFRFDWLLTAGITVGFIVVSVIGGLISVRVVARIDPVEAIS